jgi:hypothetical protein
MGSRRIRSTPSISPSISPSIFPAICLLIA